MLAEEGGSPEASFGPEGKGKGRSWGTQGAAQGPAGQCPKPILTHAGERSHGELGHCGNRATSFTQPGRLWTSPSRSLVRVSGGCTGLQDGAWVQVLLSSLEGWWAAGRLPRATRAGALQPSCSLECHRNGENPSGAWSPGKQAPGQLTVPSQSSPEGRGLSPRHWHPSLKNRQSCEDLRPSQVLSLGHKSGTAKSSNLTATPPTHDPY